MHYVALIFRLPVCAIEMGEKVIIKIRTFLDNHKPPDRVLPSML